MITKKDALKMLGINPVFLDTKKVVLEGKVVVNELVEHKSKDLERLEDYAPQMAEALNNFVLFGTTEENYRTAKEILQAAGVKDA